MRRPRRRRLVGLIAALFMSVSLLAFLMARGPATVSALAADPAVVLQQQLKEARQVALRYPTLAKALAGGYTQAAPYAPGIGSHYMKYSLIYLPFNVKAPAMLLFNGDDPKSKIVGLAYYVYHSHGPPPDTFAGPYAQWHQHQQVCVGPTGAHMDGDSLECHHRGQNAWMLHLWVVDGYQTPQAVFSNNCSILQ